MSSDTQPDPLLVSIIAGSSKPKLKAAGVMDVIFARGLARVEPRHVRAFMEMHVYRPRIPASFERGGGEIDVGVMSVSGFLLSRLHEFLGMALRDDAYGTEASKEDGDSAHLDRHVRMDLFKLEGPVLS
jgi:hypothetical protein